MEQTVQDSNVLELLSVLRENQMQDHAQDIVELLQYVASMEEKCEHILRELSEVKEQLGKLDQREEAPAAARSMTQKIEDRVLSAHEKLGQLRGAIGEAAKSMVDGFRKAGVSALRKMSEFLHIRGLLSGVQEELGHAAYGAKRTAERLEAMGDELRTASGHLRNAGRAVAGRERQPVEQRPEGCVQSAALLPLRGAHKTLVKMQVATATAMYSVARFEQGLTAQGEALSLPMPKQENQQAEADAPAFAMTM